MPEIDTNDPLPAKIASLRRRHGRIPAMHTDGAGICVSDRHKWPCDASVLLDVAEATVTLATQWRDEPQLALTQEQCAEQLLTDINRILLGEEATRG
jgi:hypothetical protein